MFDGGVCKAGSTKLRRKIICIKGDISNLGFVKKIIIHYRPQTIFHLAAEAIVEIANRNPIKTFTTNIEGTWNILEASRGKRFIEAIVSASSDKAYGNHKRLPYREDTALRGEHPYDVSKSCADLLCQTYFKTFGVPVCVTRCGNIYGPGDFHFSRIIPDSICSVLQNKKLVIRSDGQFTRDYVYVEDIVTAYLMLAQKMKKLHLFGQAFNFSNEQPIKVIDLFKEIARLCTQNGKIKMQPKILNKADFEIRHQYLSSRKARKILQWKPKHTLKQGLLKTIGWYRRNPGIEIDA